MARDNEVTAIERVLAILTALGPPARKRVVGFILQRLDALDPDKTPPPMVLFPRSQGGSDDAA
jgi:hypothetical protein